MKRFSLAALVAALMLLAVSACNDNPTQRVEECRGGWIADGRGGCVPASVAPTDNPLLNGGVVGGGSGKTDSTSTGSNSSSSDSTSTGA